MDMGMNTDGHGQEHGWTWAGTRMDTGRNTDGHGQEHGWTWAGTQLDMGRKRTAGCPMQPPPDKVRSTTRCRPVERERAGDCGWRCAGLRGKPSPDLSPPAKELGAASQKEATCLSHLAAVPQVVELRVGHSHVLLVQLRTLGASQLSARLGGSHAPQNSDAVLLTRPLEEGLEVALVDPPDGVEVGGRAVVLCVVSPLCLIHVGRPKHQQGAAGGGGVAVRRPRHQLRHEIGHHHPRTRLREHKNKNGFPHRSKHKNKTVSPIGAEPAQTAR
eukprot:scaffold19375_cov103-Isochrysis_galbana.AAC.3